jgi:hypothetical protein
MVHHVVGAAMRAPHSQSAGGQGRGFGELRCQLGDAVLIAPVSTANSLVSGNFTGNFEILGL